MTHVICLRPNPAKPIRPGQLPGASPSIIRSNLIQNNLPASIIGGGNSRQAKNTQSSQSVLSLHVLIQVRHLNRYRANTSG